MLPAINPPTDNLYKFIAIAGLVMAVAGFTFSYAVVKKYSDQSFEGLRELQTGHEMDMTNAARIAKSQREFVDKMNFEHPSEMQLELFRIEMKRLQLELENILNAAERRDDLAEKRFDRRYEIGVMEIEHSGKLTQIGFVVMTIGFSLWWRRVQRIQDQILNAELAQKTSSLAKPSELVRLPNVMPG